MSKSDPAYPPPGAPEAPPPAYPQPVGQGPPPPAGQPQGPPPPAGQQQGPPPAYPQAQYSAGGYPTQQYAPQGQYNAPPPPPGGTVIITTPGQQPGFREEPKAMTCPHCQANITTNTEYKVGLVAWGACGMAILIGLFVFPLVLLGCCFIPFCIKGLKDVNHTCPNCNQYLGTFERSKGL